jgi:hypothetical protein
MNTTTTDMKCYSCQKFLKDLPTIHKFRECVVVPCQQIKGRIVGVICPLCVDNIIEKKKDNRPKRNSELTEEEYENKHNPGVCGQCNMLSTMCGC